MYRHNDKLIVSPSDLTTYWESAFASWMDRHAVETPTSGVKQDDRDATSDLLKAKGLEHEAAVLKKLKADGKKVVTITSKDDAGVSDTIAALKSGADVVYQAYLRDLPMAGYADFLVRVETPSDLGAFSYEVWDSKLAQRVKPYYVLQMCAYAEALAKIQGRLPDHIAVVLGDGSTEHLLTNDFFHYYTKVKHRFLAFHDAFDQGQRPDPELYRSFGKWEEFAQDLLVKADSLTQIAGIRNRQISVLREAGITTMAALAAAKPTARIPGLSSDILPRLQQQCAAQIKSRGKPTPHFEVIDHSEYDGDKGLHMLPAPSKNDVYFDMEGFPLAKDGLEYLWGAFHLDGKKWAFRDFWAHDDAAEKKALEDFIDWVYGRWQTDPTMHIYHYAKYEASAIKRLMGWYGTREDEVDALLRGKVFVDLYQVVKESLVVGTDSYSIKSIERLYRQARATDVKDGGASIAVYNEWLEKRDGDTWNESVLLKSIRDYNKDDCDTMVELAAFLRDLQKAHKITISDETEASPAPVKAKPKKPNPKAKPTTEQIAEKLAAATKVNPEGEILSHLVGFHRREIKPAWWRYFDRQRQVESDLIDDHECLFRIRRPKGGKSPNTFKLAEDRHHKIKEGDKFEIHGVFRGPVFVIDSIDWSKEEITFESAGALTDGISLIPKVDDFGQSLGPAVLRYVDQWFDHSKEKCAIRSFLRRDPPRLTSGKLENILRAKGDLTTKVIDVVRKLDRSHLVIQGPPGSGKTTLAADVIKTLLEDGHRVGVVSNSHEAVNHLLRKTVAVIKGAGSKPKFKVAKVRSDAEKDDLEGTGIINYEKGGVVDYEGDNPRLVGGTVFAFSVMNATTQFEYLFVDEAGQVSVANLVAMGLAAKNLVLMGDQMQLSQPTQGSHPGDSGLSILDYRLQGIAAVPDHDGVFLPQSYRMHSSVCKLISEMIYEDKLGSHPQTDHQRVVLPKSGKSDIPEHGVAFLAVEHEGRSHESEEEIKEITKLVSELKKRSFVDRDGKDCGPLGEKDILVMAPYNVQVSRLTEALKGSARVGTIDKFQGQEAPVVIVSMCASDLESVPRGVEFLLNKNRMNVAISRAKCLAIVVGSPEIASAYVGSVGAMRLVNLYCRITQ